MRPPDVLRVLDALDRVGVRAWVAGGWGIDALIGETTRPHRDLDLAIPTEQDYPAIEALGRLGFTMLPAVPMIGKRPKRAPERAVGHSRRRLP